MESQLRFEATIARLPIYIFRSDCSSRNFRRQDPGFQSCRNSLVRAWVFEGDLSCLLLRSAVGTFRRTDYWGLFWWLRFAGLVWKSHRRILEFNKHLVISRSGEQQHETIRFKMGVKRKPMCLPTNDESSRFCMGPGVTRSGTESGHIVTLSIKGNLMARSIIC